MRYRLSNWRLWLMLTHRWMGISVGIMLVVWTVSGIVLLYYGLPHLTAAERLARLPPLDTAAIRISPLQAAEHLDQAPSRIRISMLDDRPVYRLNTGRAFGRWTLVYADTGEPSAAFDAEDALRSARARMPAAQRMRYDGFLAEPDLFTHNPGLQAHFPLHRIALDDPAGTVYYVSARSGEAVMKTDRQGRVLGFAGYLLHTLFFWRQKTWWSNLLLALTIAGLAMVLLGFILGVVRFSSKPRFSHRGVLSRSPYTALMKWHHYAGLIFGAVAVTWMFSGLVSLNVVPGIRETLYTPAQIEAGARSVQGEAATLDLARLPLESIHTAAAAIEAEFPVKELEVLTFDGAPYYLAYREPTPEERRAWRSRSAFDWLTATLDHDHRIVAAAAPGEGAFREFPSEAMLPAARRAMPNAEILAAEWLHDYDDYYYDGLASFDLGLPKAAKTLPVLRVQFDDPLGTWLYLSPSHGQILKLEAAERTNRWGYYGLHGLDFAFLFERRPLWDVVAIVLLLGVGVLSTTTLWPMALRLKRHAVRIAGRLRRLLSPAVAREAPRR